MEREVAGALMKKLAAKLDFKPRSPQILFCTAIAVTAMTKSGGHFFKIYRTNLVFAFFKMTCPLRRTKAT